MRGFIFHGRVLAGLAAASLAFAGMGCSGGTSGNPKDFEGPLDTSKAAKSSDDVQQLPAKGYKTDEHGAPILN